jgi:ATP-binding cassette subfamily B protein
MGDDAARREDKLSRDEARHVLRRSARLLRPYRRSVIIATIVLVGQTACILAGPALVGYGIDSGLNRHDAGALNLAAGLYLAVALFALVLGRQVVWLVSRIAETFLQDLRTKVFRHLLTLGMDFFEREKTGQLVARMTSDIDAMQDLVSQGLVSIAQNALLFVGAVIAIILLSPLLALCTLVLVPPLFLASAWFRRESNRAYLTVRDRIGTNLATLQEGLAGVRVVQAFSRERAWTRRFYNTNEAQFDAHMETVRIASRYFPLIEFTGVVGIALIIGLGGWFNAMGWGVTIGTIAAFVLYLNSLFEPIQQLSQQYNTVQSAAAGLHKVYSLLDTTTTISESSGAVALPANGSLEVDHVSFAYGARGVPTGDGDLVLHDVTLRVEPGERLALVGPTGAGKSTLAKLLVRFYDPRDGMVSFGGVDLRNADLGSLRERIIVVPQEGFLFAGTVRDNIRIGRPDADAAAIDAAIDALGLRERFDALPEGLETEVRERGSRLSAGERQLVSLVRAALADPAVLVLDEATSNLDPGTEQAVERALERLTVGRTVVIVAHRLSTAARADRVAVVDDGRLVELGSHDELVARGGRYAGLYESWQAGHAA